MMKKHSEKSKLTGREIPQCRSDAFGKNLLGVTYVAPDFYDDISVELLLREDDPQPCGGSAEGG